MLRQINPYKLGGKNSTYGVCLSNWMAKQDKTTFNTAVKMFGAILDSGTEYTTIYRLIRFSEHTKHCEIFTESEVSGVSSRFMELRKKMYPESAIRDALNIPIWEVYQLLDKYRAELEPLGLQRQEADNFEKGNKYFGAIKV